MRRVFSLWDRVQAYLRCKFPKKMRLGVTYNFFDGEELLEPAIKSIRSVVDYVNVVYQETSNGGEKRDASVLSYLKDLQTRGLIDEIAIYKPNLDWPPYRNERKKRLIGVRACAKKRCTHYIVLDVDEFYRASEIEQAKNFIMQNGIDVSATSIIEYVKTPNNRLVCNHMFSPRETENYVFYAPFICRIVTREDIGVVFPCLADPTRTFTKRGRFYLFPKHIVALHHMSTIRKDLDIKFRNSTLNLAKDWNQADVFNSAKKAVLEYEFVEGRIPPRGYDFIGEYLVKKVPNEFGIDLSEWTNNNN